MAGSLVSIHTCGGDHGPMRPVRDAALEVGGLPGDAHFAPGSLRELLLADAETLEALDLLPGQIRENLTLSGVEVMGLSPGTRLAIGEAEVEITKECTPCSVMDRVRPGLQQELLGRRGMYARVVAPGPIRTGDRVTVLEPAGDLA